MLTEIAPGGRFINLDHVVKVRLTAWKAEAELFTFDGSQFNSIGIVQGWAYQTLLPACRLTPTVFQSCTGRLYVPAG